MKFGGCMEEKTLESELLSEEGREVCQWKIDERVRKSKCML